MVGYFLVVSVDLVMLLDASTLIFFLENSQDPSHELAKPLQNGMQHLKQ